MITIYTREDVPVGQSNRVVIEIDQEVKRRLYAQLAREGRTLKDWFREQVDQYISMGMEGSQTPLPLYRDDRADD